MTAIVLILAALPLAVLLSLGLNRLLDRTDSAPASSRGATSSRIRGSRGMAFVCALLVAPSLFAAVEETSSNAPGCSKLECALTVDSTQIDALWSAQPSGLELIAQSRIPLWIPAEDKHAAAATRATRPTRGPALQPPSSTAPRSPASEY